MRRERAVYIRAHRLDRNVHARQPDVVLGKLCHRLEIDVLEIGIRHLGVRAKMALELEGIVVARQIEIVQPRDDAGIHDLHDVRLLQVFRHSVDRAPIFRQRRRADAFAVTLHHLRQIKIDLVAGAVLHQGGSVAVPNLAADGWDPHRRLRAAADFRRPFRPVRHLHVPKPAEQRAESCHK